MPSGRVADRLRIFLTGSTGTMGSQALARLLEAPEGFEVVVLSRDSKKNRRFLAPYIERYGMGDVSASRLDVRWGDLTDYAAVRACVQDADIVLHVAALVSPAADYHPREAMCANYGSTRNIIEAIHELGQDRDTALVYIGTIAQTGDRMPPIHWGRVGDPIKPSMFDYYAVSKVAAERLVIESDIERWVSLRQTGIIGPAMGAIRDAIMFHNCYDNMLEYVSDRDSGVLLGNLCHLHAHGLLPRGFWGHAYNIGGGKSCQMSGGELFETLYGTMGIQDPDIILKPRMQATRNFHGQLYLDSDKLQDILHFRHDTMDYCFRTALPSTGIMAVLHFICSTSSGQRVFGNTVLQSLRRLAHTEHGTLHFIEDDIEDHIDAYWGSREAWESIPERYSDFKRLAERDASDLDTVVPIDHGYDEAKPEAELSLADVAGAAAFRGGTCLAPAMTTGDWTTKLPFHCAFGHDFMASPRLVLEGGHWCPQCERTSWNYAARAKVDPFFSQVWTPLHPAGEPQREYPKTVSELDV